MLGVLYFSFLEQVFSYLTVHLRRMKDRAATTSVLDEEEHLRFHRAIYRMWILQVLGEASFRIKDNFSPNLGFLIGLSPRETAELVEARDFMQLVSDTHAAGMFTSWPTPSLPPQTLLVALGRRNWLLRTLYDPEEVVYAFHSTRAALESLPSAVPQNVFGVRIQQAFIFQVSQRTSSGDARDYSGRAILDQHLARPQLKCKHRSVLT